MPMLIAGISLALWCLIFFLASLLFRSPLTYSVYHVLGIFVNCVAFLYSEACYWDLVARYAATQEERDIAMEQAPSFGSLFMAPLFSISVCTLSIIGTIAVTSWFERRSVQRL